MSPDDYVVDVGVARSSQRPRLRASPPSGRGSPCRRAIGAPGRGGAEVDAAGRAAGLACTARVTSDARQQRISGRAGVAERIDEPGRQSRRSSLTVSTIAARRSRSPSAAGRVQSVQRRRSQSGQPVPLPADERALVLALDVGHPRPERDGAVEGRRCRPTSRARPGSTGCPSGITTGLLPTSRSGSRASARFRSCVRCVEPQRTRRRRWPGHPAAPRLPRVSNAEVVDRRQQVDRLGS